MGDGYALRANMGRIARVTNTIMSEAIGMISNAVFNCEASLPAIEPIIRELTARPIHPQVMTTPIAVAVILGKASPTMASVVGNTGAIARPAQKTKIPAMN